MRITKIDIKPHEQVFEPEFLIEIQIECQAHQVPINITGDLRLNLTNWRVGLMTPVQVQQGIKDIQMANPDRTNVIISQPFVVPISRFVLEKVDEIRRNNSKGDIEFVIILNGTFIQPTLSGNAVHGIAQYSMYGKHRISASDWIQDFLRVFNSSHYQIVELPIPDHSGIPSDHPIHERLLPALSSLERMSKARMDGDWNGVVEYSRSIWELIRNRDEVYNILEAENMDTTAIRSYTNLIESLYSFCSKFIHKQTKSHVVMKPNIASKEDADFIYSTAIYVLNLLSKKLMRTHQSVAEE